MTDEEIVRAVAEKVMGWKEGGEFCANWRGHGWYTHSRWEACTDWNPLTNDADACMVIRKMVELRWWVNICYASWSHYCGWHVAVVAYPISKHYAGDPTELSDCVTADGEFNRAVCECALKAVGAYEEPPK